jgi:hypothetical protein
MGHGGTRRAPQAASLGPGETPGASRLPLPGEVLMPLEEKVIASWKYKKGSLDQKTAFLCYLAANLAAGNTH